ncbi:hypothetical protein D6D62_06530 [Moraxella catarrhalis]|nr:hypothetical protein D6D62_06530 [Moraxella catarrhalis]
MVYLVIIFGLITMQIKLSNLSERVSAPYGLVKQIMGHRPTATDEKHDKDRLIDLLSTGILSQIVPLARG